MAITVKLLLKGEFNTATPYSPGAGKGAVVKSIVVTNKGTVAGTTSITLTGRNLCPPNISIPAKCSLILDSEVTLSDSDSLSIIGSGTDIEFLVSGIERNN